MDFKTITSNLLTALGQGRVSYALIGGFAVSLWGYQRATVDMDFLVNRNDMEKVRRIVEGLGYRCIHVSENVTQFVSDDKRFGNLDFLHAFRPASLSMLERAVLKTVFDNEQTIPVILPEDLIGLKIQAINNDPLRTALDMGDIEALMAIFGAELDWERIEGYFALFELQKTFEELRLKYNVFRE
ncbi:MAG: nucleotidyltransferase family protein [Desulfuromonadales bacterium]|nr:nucleotidyltransferase family protein [Desulfuromonadales bacterium]